MTAKANPGHEAVEVKGWFGAHKWLLARRFSQVAILALFLVGPLFGYYIVKGTIASSLTLDVLPLTDPFMLIQSWLAGHQLESTALIGAAIVVVTYLIVGGRVYCSWVCPVNIITDAAHWVRQKLDIRGGLKLTRGARYWLLGMALVTAFAGGIIAWELVNPVTLVFRALVFGVGWAWGAALAVFLFDLFVSERGWCSHLCPVGAFYSLLGSSAVLRVRATRRDACNNCMDCFAVCPEQQVITPALRGADKGVGPVILSPNCTNCGRCIDVCSLDVFEFGTRFNNRSLTTDNKENGPVLGKAA